MPVTRLNKSLLSLTLFAVALFRSGAQESVYSGAFVGGNGGIANNLSGVLDYETNSAKPLSIVNYFKNWEDNSGPLSFSTSAMDSIRAHGSIPMVSWQPEGASPDAAYACSNVVNGNFDELIRDWALDAKAWGHPFFLRFAHEMNGNWYPWCSGVNGNSSADYIAEWRHVHDIFVNVGATNVTWIWCVNTKFSGSPAIAGLYPGDNYVDWISLDSYNRISNAWGDFSSRSQATLDELLGIAPGKPILVAEVGCHEDDVDVDRKAQWYRNAMKSYLKVSMPRIKAWVYFNGNNPDGNDWRITTSTNALAGYQESIGLSYYSSNRFGAITDTPIQPLLNDATATDTMAPFVSIVKPAVNHVRTGAQIEILAPASDKSGITKVVFSVNGVAQQTNTFEPYQYFWSVPATSGVACTLAAKAYDGAGNTCTSIVQVVSQNAITVTLTNSDTLNINSFITPENWDSGRMPEVGSDYVVPSGLLLRTPIDQTQPFNFAGDSLTLAGLFVFKMTNVITVSDLRLTNGTVANYSTGGNPDLGRLAGSINVLANGTFDAGGGSLAMHIMASIRGNGGLTLTRPSTIFLSGDASAYTGNWTNLSSNIEIWSGAVNPLGSGSVILMNSTNSLTFNATNDLTIPAAITGTGCLIKQNPNTVTLAGRNSFIGGTTLNAGTIRIGSTGSLRGSVTNSGVMTVASGGSFFATNLIVGFNSLNCTNGASSGAIVSVGSGPAHSLLVGYRTVSTTGVSAFGLMDVSALSNFTANVGNLLVGYNASSGGTGASVASGRLLLATNNSITATNILIGYSPGTASGASNLIVLGAGTNTFNTPLLTVGGLKEHGALTLNSGGIFTLSNGVNRANFNVGLNNASTSASNNSVCDLSAGVFRSSLSNWVIGLKSGGGSGGANATVLLSTNAASSINANALVIGSLAGASSASSVAQGTLTFGGGGFLVNSNVTLASFDGGLGSAIGTLNINGGTFVVAGNILDGGGASALKINSGIVDLKPPGDSTAGSLTVKTLLLNGIITNALNITVTNNFYGSGSIVNQSGVTTALGSVTPGGTNTIATLTTGSLTLLGLTILELNRTNAQNADLLAATSVTFGGTLTVTNLGGPLQVGDTFNLFDGAISGTFATTNLPVLSSTNFYWDTTQLMSQGIIKVGLKAAVSPTILSPTFDGTNFSMQVSSQTGFNYVLEATPQLTPANWTGIQTKVGGGGLAFTVPMNSTNAQRFFRLRVE